MEVRVKANLYVFSRPMYIAGTAWISSYCTQIVHSTESVFRR